MRKPKGYDGSLKDDLVTGSPAQTVQTPVPGEGLPAEAQR